MFMVNNKSTSLRNNEKGFASMVVAIIFIIVLSLLTIGFAQLSRREQTNALNNQLATEAQNAAESGINDAEQDIANGYIVPEASATDTAPAGYPYTYKTQYIVANNTTNNNICLTKTGSSYGSGANSDPIPAGALTANPNVNPNDGVSYTCLLVNLTPPQLTAPGIPEGSEWYQTFSNGSPLTALNISWQSKDEQQQNYNNSINTSKNLLPIDTWNSDGYGPLIQFSITPLTSPSAQTSPSFSRADLLNNTLTVYLYPSNSTSDNSIAYESYVSSYSTNSSLSNPNYAANASNGQFVSGACGTIPISSRTSNNPYDCNATITGLNLSSGTFSGPYLVTAISYYDNSPDISLSATTTGNTSTPFINGQATIDVTGEAHNVLKRLHKVVPIFGLEGNNSGGSTTPLPGYALQAQQICKQFTYAPAPDPTTGADDSANPNNCP